MCEVMVSVEFKTSLFLLVVVVEWGGRWDTARVDWCGEILTWLVLYMRSKAFLGTADAASNQIKSNQNGICMGQIHICSKHLM